LIEYLRHYINDEQTDWDEWIPYAMFTYNTTPHTATAYTPFELIYGHQAMLPMALSLSPKPTYSYDDYAEELKQKLRATQQLAKGHLHEVKIRAKTYADKNINFKTFKIGDKVLLQDGTVTSTVLRLRHGRSKKLDAQWTGPYRVVEKISDVIYKIQIKRKTTCVHANRLKPFVEH